MDLLYTKYSSDRKDEYKIRTSIYEDKDKRIVIKEALEDIGIKHIENIYNNYFLLSKLYLNKKSPRSVKINKPKFQDGKLFLEYEEGQTLSSLIIKCVKKKDYNELYNLLDLYKNILIGFDENNIISFCYTTEFYDLFGRDIDGLEGVKAINIANLDLNFDNIIINDNNIIILDYEWIYNFPIPLDFVLSRNINVFSIIYNDELDDTTMNYLYNYMDVVTERKLNNSIILTEKFRQHINIKNGIDESKIKQNYVKNKIVYDFNDLKSEKNIQVFIKKLNGIFSEEDSITHNIGSGREVYKIDLSNYENIESIRIDPTNFVANIKLYSFKCYDKDNFEIKKTITRTSGIVEYEEILYCINHDPQIYVVFENIEDIKYIELELELIDDNEIKVLTEVEQIFKKLFNLNSNLKREIEENLQETIKNNEKVITLLIDECNDLKENILNKDKYIKELKFQSEKYESTIIDLQNEINNYKDIEKDMNEKVCENVREVDNLNLQLLEKNENMFELQHYIDKINKNKILKFLMKIGIIKV